jgi:hypothetical protein
MMKTTTQFRLIFLLLFAWSLSFSTKVSAQYCDPTFVNGCSLWGNQTITLETLNWSLGSSPCTDYDYTWMSANLTTGIPHLLTVTNGDWCGCAVWIDFDQNSTFDTYENIFYQYLPNASNTYSIYFTVPNGTPIGAYRMRIVSPWGSDGFQTTNVNGYGPCGAYQYGGYQDFTINITGPQGLEDVTGNTRFMTAAMNNDNNQLVVTVASYRANNVILQLTDVSGRQIETRKVKSEKEVFDVSALAKGVYFLNYFDGAYRQNIKLTR